MHPFLHCCALHSPQSTDLKAHMTDHPMHHPTLHLTPTNSIPSASTIASICHTNDVKLLSPQQNPPTGPQPTTSSSTITCHQHSANTTTQQPSYSEGIPTWNKSSCNNSEPSFSISQNDTNLQNYTTPYLHAYWYKNFCNTHNTLIQPESIWYYKIWYHQLQNNYLQWCPTRHL